jgi:AcrR family transcriptional regulator
VAAGARVYGGVSADERRARRRELLLDAGLALFGVEGFSATTMTAVCARAKLTERYFYESFADKEELLVAVFDRIAAEAAEVVLAAVEDSPPDARAGARAAIGAFFELMTDDPRKGRIAFIEAMGSEALMRRRFETLDSFAALLSDQARAFYELEPGDGDRMVRLTSFLLVGGLAETLIAWLNGALDTTREQLIGDCTDLFVATGEAAVALARPD